MSVLDAMTTALIDGSPIAVSVSAVFAPMLTGKFSRRGRKDVYHIFERDARLLSQIACMNFANAASTEDRYIRHLIPSFFICL